MLISRAGSPHLMSLKIKPGCHTLSNVFSKSRGEAAVFFLKLVEKIMSSRTLTSR